MLPLLTATCSEGEMMVPDGIRTSSGTRQPELSGISIAMRTRRQYRMADFATADGALRL